MKILISEQQLRRIITEQSSGSLIPSLGYKIINDIEHAYSFTDPSGKISGGNYNGTEKESNISEYINNTIGLDNWSKLNDLFKVQLYSYMYQHDSGDGGMRMWWIAGLAQSIDPKIDRSTVTKKPVDDPNVVNAIKIIKNACQDGSINSYYKKWLSVVDEQMKGTGSKHPDNYKNVWKNRPKAIERLMNGESWDVVKKEFNSTVVSKSTNTQVVDKKIDNKNIVGKDNMYNRLVKAFGSKVVGKFDDPNSYDFILPNKTYVFVSYTTDELWEIAYYPEENVYPNMDDGNYFYSEGEIELIGDLDFKITLYNNDGTYDSQTKKWNGSSDVLPLPKREDPKSIIQSKDIFRRLFKFYGKKMVISTLSYNDRLVYYAKVNYDNNESNYFNIYNNDNVRWIENNEDRNTGQSISIDNDDFQLKFQDGLIFDSKTKKWTKGKPFKTVSIEGKNMTEFASKIVKETKNLKIDLDSFKVDADNFKLKFNTTEDGTSVYKLYLSLSSSKNPYDKPESILNNFPKSKIIGRGNFPNKPENNYTLIAIIV
jgi:hypothetical protein